MKGPVSTPTISQNGISTTDILILASAAAVFLPFALFQSGGPDEGIWIYQSFLVSLGRLPPLDFFSHHPITFLGLFGAPMAILAPGMDTGRAMAFLITMASALLLFRAALAVWGKGAARAALAAYLLNATFVWFSFSVYAMGPAALGLTGILYCLSTWRAPAGFSRHLVLGLFTGLVVGARLPLALVSLVIAAFVLFGPEMPQTSLRRRWANLAVTVAAAMFMVSPDLYIFAKDPELFIFARANAFQQYLAIQGPMRGWGTGILGLLKGLPHVIAEFLLISPGYASGQNLLLPLAIVVATVGWAHHRRAPSSPLRWALALAGAALVGIASNYGILAGGAYFNFAFPLLVFAVIGLAVEGLSNAPPFLRHFLLCGLVGYAALGGVHVAWQIVFRNTASFVQPVAVARMACWLERATAPDDRILAAWPAALAGARRHLPRGMETAGLLNAWSYLPPETLQHFGVATIDDIDQALTDGTVAILIDDTFVSGMVEGRRQTQLGIRITSNYTELGSLGGERAPARILAHKTWLARVGNAIPPVVDVAHTQATMGLLRSQGAGAFARAFFADITVSLATLPRDLVASLARIGGRSPCLGTPP